MKTIGLLKFSLLSVVVGLLTANSTFAASPSNPPDEIRKYRCESPELGIAMFTVSIPEKAFIPYKGKIVGFQIDQWTTQGKFIESKKQVPYTPNSGVDYDVLGAHILDRHGEPGEFPKKVEKVIALRFPPTRYKNWDLKRNTCYQRAEAPGAYLVLNLETGKVDKITSLDTEPILYRYSDLNPEAIWKRVDYFLYATLHPFVGQQDCDHITQEYLKTNNFPQCQRIK